MGGLFRVEECIGNFNRYKGDNMNHKAMARGALALTLGFIVGTACAADVQKYGATFEPYEKDLAGMMNDYEYELGTNITKYADIAGNSGWFAGEGDESKIISHTDALGEQALQLSTAASTLTNKLSQAVADEINTNGIAVAGAYIETDVKFVASDMLDAGVAGGTDGTKFAIYAYCDRDSGTSTTNLVVYHGVMEGNGTITYTNEVFDNILINGEVYTKLRVDIKKDGAYTVFSVKIDDGEPLSSNLAYSDGIWFLSTEKMSDGVKPMTCVTFKGSGEVDNLSVGIVEAASPKYRVYWNDSSNVSAYVDDTLWDDPDYEGYGYFTAGTYIEFRADSGMMITNVDGVAISPVSSYDFTVTQATNIVLRAGHVEQSGRTKPNWAEQADTDMFWDWVDNHGVDDYDDNDYTAEYLLNVTTGFEPGPEIRIVGIEVGATATTIEVRGGNRNNDNSYPVDFSNLNGVLNVEVGDSVANLTPKAIPAENLVVDPEDPGWAIITIPNADGCFFRARVDFEAAETALTAVSTGE